jgi:hypothetical protein
VIAFPLLVGNVHLFFELEVFELDEVILATARMLVHTLMQAVRAVFDVSLFVDVLVDPGFHC